MPKTDLLNPVSLDVYAGEKKVGTLAELPDHRIAFEYDKDWLKDGFSISPFSLPLNPGVFIPKTYGPLDGLFGVFADSLPDGWGALLTDRFLRSYNIDPISLTPPSASVTSRKQREKLIRVSAVHIPSGKLLCSFI